MSGLSITLLFLLLTLALALLPGFCYLNSYLTGWLALSRRFRATTSIPTDALTVGPRALRVYMARWAKMEYLVSIAVTREGIYLTARIPFAIAHPPLFLPWHETHIAHDRRWFQDFTVITLGNSERIPLRIPTHAAESLHLSPSTPQSPSPNA